MAATTSTVLSILQIVLTLEPAALQLVLSLVNGLSGKTDAEILAADSSTWATILANAKVASQPPTKP
jgi:hypothetical protein